MRWLIAVLIAANLVLLLWHGVGDDPIGHKGASPEPAVGDLRLLSELEAKGPRIQEQAVSPPLDKSPAKPRAQEQAIRSSEQPVTASTTPDFEPIDIIIPDVGEAFLAKEREGPEALGITSENMNQPAQAVIDASEPETPGVLDIEPGAVLGSEEPVGHEPETVPQRSPEQASEQAKQAQAQAQAQAQVQAEEPEPKAPERVCWRLGPFEDESQALSLVPELPTGVEKLATRKMQVRVPNGFYVLIPASADRAAALAIVKELKAKGIKDSWVFVRGTLKNAISLGMFSRERNATRRLEAVRSKGFTVELFHRHKRTERVALLVGGTSGGAAERTLRRLSANQLESIPCP